MTSKTPHLNYPTGRTSSQASQLSIAPLMLDIEGCTLSDADTNLLSDAAVGGIILFARNIESPSQIRQLCDAMRAIKPNILIGIDQEGGRVARLRQGFTPLPAMGRLGERFTSQPDVALALAMDCGYVMACEVLAVGIDISFAPVLDIDAVSTVIGDRSFHQSTEAIVALASAFMQGMQRAGMASTGKHFPGHGNVVADSHHAVAVDNRPLSDILKTDLQPFIGCLPYLNAMMPAHVIYPKVDDKPAGFSKIWLQDIARDQLGFDGVLFSDDLSMQAAHIAGNAADRVLAALNAGCDMALVCNDRRSALDAVEAVHANFDGLNNHLSQQRLAGMQSSIPLWQGSLEQTCHQFDDWQEATLRIRRAFFGESAQPATYIDPTNYC